MTSTVSDLKNMFSDPDLAPPIAYKSLNGSRSQREIRRYQRVMLISPPATLYAGDLPRCTYPLGLGYIAAILERNGYDVCILDCLVEGYYQKTPVPGDDRFITYGLSEEQIESQIAAFAPDVVGVSSIFSNQSDAVSMVFRAARRVNPAVKLATGGAHARYFPMNYVEEMGVNAVFLSEAEITFLEYLDHLNDELEIEALSSVVISTDNGIYSNAGMSLIREKRKSETGAWAELDQIPFPAWHLYNMEKYFSIGAYQSPYTIGDRVGQIYTSRGCTAKCTFCTTTNFWGGKLRRRSPENVYEELSALMSKYGINEYHIQDDNITNDKAHAKTMFRYLTDIKLPWCTPQGTALWRMDEELLELMAGSGCYQITFAIESGVQRVLDELIRKPLNLERTKHLIGYARSLGMSVHGFFIIGMPPMFGNNGETVDEMWRTYRYAEDCGFNSASFFTATPIVGSVLLTECLRQKFVSSDTPLYRMSYKQGLISVPGLWDGLEIAELASRFNRDFNQKNEGRKTRKQWQPTQY